jgi:hypothetical protein
MFIANNTVLINYICSGCNKSFKSTKSLEFHYEYCIYHNYKKNYPLYISNESIKFIIELLNTLSLYNVESNDRILISDIKSNLNKMSSIRYLNNTIYTNILIIFDNINQNYISYNEVLNIISLCFSIQIIDINNIIDTYNNCTSNLNNKFYK